MHLLYHFLFCLKVSHNHCYFDLIYHHSKNQFFSCRILRIVLKCHFSSLHNADHLSFLLRMHLLCRFLSCPNLQHRFDLTYHRYTENQSFSYIDLVLARCLFAFIQPMILGIDQPTMELTITPYKGIQYSGGIGGGTFSKLAMKLPLCVTLKIADYIT